MNVKNLVLGIGIVIVYALVLWQGIETFYPSPEYNDFCSYDRTNPDGVVNESQCVLTGGRWNKYDSAYKPIGVDNATGYCDMYFKCNQEHEEARAAYSWKAFLISIIVGIITLIVGYLFLTVEPVGSALIGSGIWAIFWGSVINWRNFASGWRFLLLFLALILLIWIAMRLNKRSD